MAFYSPLRYPGGKNCIFKFVANLFIENDFNRIHYAEPYAGGAGLALRLLFEEYVDHIFINDFDRSIFAFWESVINRTDDLCAWIEEVDISMDSWFKYREIQKKVYSIDNFELAKSTLFLNRTNVSGVIKGGVIGGLEQKGKYKITARFNKMELISRIQKIARYRNRITVTNLDGLEFITMIENKQEDVFIYLDPPYFQKGAELYMNFYKKADHEKLSEHVHAIQKKWMVSYDNHDFIIKLYNPDKKITYKLSQNTSNRVGEEILIFSNKISFTQSMNKLASAQLLNISL